MSCLSAVAAITASGRDARLASDRAGEFCDHRVNREIDERSEEPAHAVVRAPAGEQLTPGDGGPADRASVPAQHTRPRR
jgi:hypothetical protein